MKHAAAKIVPKLRNDIAQEMLTTFNDNADLLKKVTTGMVMTLKPKPDYTNVSVQKCLSVLALQVRSNAKVLLIVFFDCNSVVHHEFLPQSHTVNKEYYLEVMHRFH